MSTNQPTVKYDLSLIGKDNKFVTPSTDPYLEYYAEYFQLFGRESPATHKQIEELREELGSTAPLSAIALAMRPTHQE